MIAGPSTRKRPGKAAMALLAMIAAAAFRPSAASAQAAGAQPERVLVLTVTPFKTMAEPAFSYLGDGFTEALTTKLVGLPRVKIFERSQFAKLAAELKLERDSAGLFDASTLARAGAVVSIDYALLGSVGLSGTVFSCNVRLVHVGSGKVALAKEFRGAFPAELFSAQDAAAVAVAEALSIRLGDLELKRIATRPTEDADAYGMYNRSLCSGDQAERIKLLEAATARDPSFAMAWHLLADAYLALGKPDRAEAAYGRLIAIDPSDYRASYNLALLLLDDGAYAEARALLERCAELKPGDADALYHIGFSREFSPDGERYGLGADLQGALERYRVSMAADPRHAEARIAGGTLCGILAQAEPDTAARLAMLREAERYLSEYLALEPDALDAEVISATIETVRAAIVEHEAYLKTIH